MSLEHSPARDNRAAFSISEFCRMHGIGRTLFYNLPPHERPAIMMVGGKRLISAEAAEAWRRRMERRTSD